MIRCEQDHQFRIELCDPLPGVAHHAIDLGQNRWKRVDMTDQWGMRQALQIGTHFWPPCLHERVTRYVASFMSDQLRSRHQ
ncbi:hypothetical protein D3C71_1955010 [compost metagenome]